MKSYAPVAGIIRFSVSDGQAVDTGAELAVVESVKLEAPVLAPGPGIVRLGAVGDHANVTGGDAILELVEQ